MNAPEDDRWPLIAALSWIATRSFERARINGIKGVAHLNDYLSGIRSAFRMPPGPSAQEAKAELWAKLEAGEISGRATRALLTFETIERLGASTIHRVVDEKCDRDCAFPPPGDLGLPGRLIELPGGNYRETPGPNPAQEIDWRDITFSRTEVLRLWPEHPQTIGHRLAKKTPWSPPQGLNKASLALLPEGKRVALEAIVNLLAFAQTDTPPCLAQSEAIAARMRAAYALFAAARDERVELFGTPTPPGEYPFNARFRQGTREPIASHEFDNEALALSHAEPSAISSEEIAANWADKGAHGAAIKWFGVTVDRASFGGWLGASIAATRRKAKSSGVTACIDWLVGLRKSGPPDKTKEAYKAEAKARFDLGPDQFETAWKQAATSFPCGEWGKPGRPKLTGNHAARKSSAK